jgi:integrase
LRIDAVFGDYPVNAIRREHVSDWVGRMKKAGKSRSTIRNALFLVRMMLRYAADEKWIPSNPAADVKLPRSTSVGEPGVVDDPAQFLTAAQVAALVAATPWPYSVLVHVAAWSGLRAGELAGLEVGDVELPTPSLKPNVPTKPGGLHVARTLARVGAELRYLPPKTKGSRRRVPLTAATTALLRDYLAVHPRGNEPTAPLFPSVTLKAQRPTGVRNPEGVSAVNQARALADLTTAEAAERLVLDWATPYRHATFYKAVFRPAVVRAIRAATVSGEKAAALPTGLTWHALRHTYASLCVAAGLSALEVSRFMGHSKPTTTLAIYTHLFNTDDHADAMAALGAMVATPPCPRTSCRCMDERLAATNGVWVRAVNPSSQHAVTGTVVRDGDGVHSDAR